MSHNLLAQRAHHSGEYKTTVEEEDRPQVTSACSHEAVQLCEYFTTSSPQSNTSCVAMCSNSSQNILYSTHTIIESKLSFFVMMTFYICTIHFSLYNFSCYY